MALIVYGAGCSQGRREKSEWPFERKSRFDWMDKEPLLKLRISWSEVLPRCCSEVLSIAGILIRQNQAKRLVCMTSLQEQGKEGVEVSTEEKM